MIKFFITYKDGYWIILFPSTEVLMYADEPEKSRFIEIFVKDVVMQFAGRFHNCEKSITIKENYHEAWFMQIPQYRQEDFIAWLKQTAIYVAGVSIGIDVEPLENY